MEIKINAVIKFKNKYLIIKRTKEDGGFWQTVTGTVKNKDKTLSETIQREVFEETKLSVFFIDEPFHFFIWKKDKKDVIEFCYLVQATNDKVKLSKEHVVYEWLSLTEAIKRVKKENNKNCLKKLK
jgi:dATP pyrophosphohydrolase